MRTNVLVVAGALFGACGTLGGDGGGGDRNLPSAELGPWRLLETDETRSAPFLSTARTVVGGPHVTAEDDGRFSLYYAAEDGTRTSIVRESSKGGVTFVDPEPVLAPEAPWEGASVSDPCVVRDGDVWRLYYEGEGGIGVAERRGAGAGPFVRVSDAPVLVAPARAPSVVADGEGGWRLYYESDDGISLATSADGLSFTRVGDVAVLAPDVSDPAARVHVSPTGRETVQLFFVVLARAPDATSATFVGAAASFDGATFSRAESPVLEVGRPIVGLGAPVDVDAFDLLPLTIERGEGFGVAGGVRGP